MNNTPMRALALAVLAAVCAPGAIAPGHGAEHVYVLASEAATLSVEIRYADGVATTKFAFVQLAGANGGPGERLKPTPECTEWIGTFTQAAAHAGSDDAVESSLVRVRFDNGHAPLNAPGTYTNVPLDLEVFAGPGGLTGRILTCDEPEGGLLKMTLNLPKTYGQYPPAIVRVALEESS